MSDLIKYDYEAIRAGLEDIGTRQGILLAQGEDVRGQQIKLAGYWEDEQSATNYQAHQARWNEGFENILSLLSRVRDAAGGAVDGMQATNSRVASGWHG
ncbi:WXG100 family type VII secretion target [Tsukamurella sp. 8F]|uniref:WXG100 family type VII secretion target n=1 Tax=unclassified Tsukamurella TaxID=2633480 RepID=UPI0023B94DFF|nr:MULTISPECIES: WXG100 family type VII secretion target [unclassified Tsukamurella]MDF0531750.1 WXG100 family type VII secretion target [Tsukamurella sp. 8J]MDF0589536.1 WXG100 family type VII secretion target [Tsukamurella sp. 8F]